MLMNFRFRSAEWGNTGDGGGRAGRRQGQPGRGVERVQWLEADEKGQAGEVSGLWFAGCAFSVAVFLLRIAEQGAGYKYVLSFFCVVEH